MSELTLDSLRELLTEVAGADEGAGPSPDFGRLTFDELGYDSLALMEMAARLERDYGVVIDDEQIDELETPADVLELVNKALAGSL